MLQHILLSTTVLLKAWSSNFLGKNSFVIRIKIFDLQTSVCKQYQVPVPPNVFTNTKYTFVQVSGVDGKTWVPIVEFKEIDRR
jgi:hypothetical protein